MSSSEPLYSFHAFLFPFEWKRKDSERELLEDQTKVLGIREIMKLANEDWEDVPTWAEPSTLVQYNEANYFYDFVRPVLYGDGGNIKFQVYFKNKRASGSEYVITLHSGKEYRLELDDIGISFYNTGVGLLSFHCYNRSYGQPEEILKINQFGRRLFPPFYGTDVDKIGTQAFFDDKDWKRGLGISQQSELAHSIRLEKNGSSWASEIFTQWVSRPSLDAVPGLIGQILPSALLDSTLLSPVLDDRMFVVCWYGNTELANKMSNLSLSADPEETDWWYQYIFVDGGYRSCRDVEMVKELLKGHSYVRWQKDGTLYGVSRYSFVCLTESLSSGFFPKLLLSHTQTVYYKIAELALVQRACVLRFSNEVMAIANFEKGDRKLAAKASSLTRLYIRFINKIYFREVTAQEQGIELYDMLQKHMRLENQVKDLDREIQELHQYVSMQEVNTRNKTLDILTYIGAFFVVPSFICTYLSIGGFDFKESYILISSLCLMAAFSFYGVIRAKSPWRWIFMITSILIMLYILFLFPEGRFLNF